MIAVDAWGKEIPTSANLLKEFQTKPGWPLRIVRRVGNEIIVAKDHDKVRAVWRYVGREPLTKDQMRRQIYNDYDVNPKATKYRDDDKEELNGDYFHKLNIDGAIRWGLASLKTAGVVVYDERAKTYRRNE